MARLENVATLLLVASAMLIECQAHSENHNHDDIHHHHESEERDLLLRGISFQQHKRDGFVCGTHDNTAFGRDSQAKALTTYRNRIASGAAQTVFPVTIPVCMHVARTKKGENDISNAKLQEQMDNLNTAFSAASCCSDATDGDWCMSRCSIETGFRFAFAVMDSNGNLVDDTTTVATASDPSACITRSVNWWWAHNPWGLNFPIWSFQSKLYKGNPKVLNVWWPRMSGGLNGYATFPWRAENPGLTDEDGVVVGTLTLPGGDLDFRDGDTLAHEVGHWLGLQHPYAGGCGASDGVDDTPKQSGRMRDCDEDDFDRDTCPDDPGDNNVHNFMDGVNDICSFLFTAGQAELMRASYDYFRAGNRVDAMPLADGVPSSPVFLVSEAPQFYFLDTQRRTTCTASSGGNEGADISIALKWEEPPQFKWLKNHCWHHGSPVSCTAKPKKGKSRLYIGLTPKAISSISEVTVTCSTA